VRVLYFGRNSSILINMNDFYIILGKKIKEIRQKIGMTQEELAWKCGISLNFLGQIERGQKKPSIETIKKIAEALEISPSAFFDKMPYPSPKEDILTKKIKLLLREGSEEDRKMIYNIMKSILIKRKRRKEK